MAKNKKAKGPNPKILKSKDKLESISKLNADQGTVYIPSEAVVNVPISGSFRYAIEDVLHFIMKDMSPEEIIIIMNQIRTNFKDVKDEVPLRDKAIWTLMSLLSEINYQAADQKLTRYTEKPINEEMAGIINKMNVDDADSARNMADYSEAYKKHFKINEGSDQ
jgi:hypothetical protein